MQYGNRETQIKINKIKCRLNRTMQYGNYNEVFKMCFPRHCLNRTMQYGNSGGQKEGQGNFKEFKSYYVVWKLHPARH